MISNTSSSPTACPSKCSSTVTDESTAASRRRRDVSVRASAAGISIHTRRSASWAATSTASMWPHPVTNGATPRSTQPSPERSANRHGSGRRMCAKATPLRAWPVARARAQRSCSGDPDGIRAALAEPPPCCAPHECSGETAARQRFENREPLELVEAAAAYLAGRPQAVEAGVAEEIQVVHRHRAGLVHLEGALEQHLIGELLRCAQEVGVHHISALRRMMATSVSSWL